MSTQNLFQAFLETYQPRKKLSKPNRRMLRKMSALVPKQLLEMWKTYGFGSYGNGIIKVVDPTQYMESLYTWLGGHDLTKIPIMVTAFGNIIYYRKLTDTEDDICILDIHNRKIDVLAYSFESFFKSVVTDKEFMDEILDAEIYNKSLELKGELKDNEIFCFVPALVLGGAKSAEKVDKADAAVHHQLLFRLGL